MIRWLFAAVVVLGGMLGVADCPAAGDSSKSPPKAKAKVEPKAYDLLQTKSSQHEMADAYLLGYASCYVYPEYLGVKDRDDYQGFTKAFEKMFQKLGVKKVEYIADEKTGTDVIVMSTDGAVLVVFRGSETRGLWATIKDWKTNFTTVLVKAPELSKTAQVHKGMHDAVESVYGRVLKEVKRQGGFKKRVYSTGYSLGGGLALIWAVKAYADDQGKPVVYSFGAPRSGDEGFKKAASGLDVHRWVNRQDVVPMMPSDTVLSYCHVGRTHNIKTRYKVCLDDKEYRTYDPRNLSISDHHIKRYLEALYENLDDDVQKLMPKPPE